MFEKYSIRNFKIHQDSTGIEFPGLTILTGTNNSGKTSLIQMNGKRVTMNESAFSFIVTCSSFITYRFSEL